MQITPASLMLHLNAHATFHKRSIQRYHKYSNCLHPMSKEVTLLLVCTCKRTIYEWSTTFVCGNCIVTVSCNCFFLAFHSRYVKEQCDVEVTYGASVHLYIEMIRYSCSMLPIGNMYKQNDGTEKLPCHVRKPLKCVCSHLIIFGCASIEKKNSCSESKIMNQFR